MGERKVKQVSFSLDDDFERKLYEHADAQIFSKYVKRLIDRDLNGSQDVEKAPQITEAPKEMGIRRNPDTFI